VHVQIEIRGVLADRPVPRQLDAEARRLELEKAKLESEVRALETNPRAVEKEARDKLWLIKPGEKVLVVPKTPKK